MSSHVHISPNRMYFAVFGSLMALTALTVWVAFQHFPGPLNDIIAIGIAVIKASLVILFFMHVKYGSRLNKLVVLAGVVWVLLMFGLTLTDYLTRQTIVRDPAGLSLPQPFDESEVLSSGGGH